MTREKSIAHWQKRAQAELKAAQALFEKADKDLYGEVLFHCHLALELAMKSAYIREKDAAAPFTHDLTELADCLQWTLSEAEQGQLDEITEFAILSRYGDEEWHALHATKEKAEEWLRQTGEILSRLLQP